MSNDYDPDDYFSVGVDDDSLSEAKAEMNRRRKPRRFFLKPGASREIIMLDDILKAYAIWEHEHVRQLSPIKWLFNYYTCRRIVKADQRCPLCFSGDESYYVAFLTILDHTGYQDPKTGEVRKNIRQLFPMKISTVQQLKELRKNKGRGSMAGWKVRVIRSDKNNSAKCGDTFDFIEKVNPAEDKEFWFETKDGKKMPPEIYDYREMFRPPSYEAMLGIQKMMSSGGGDFGGDVVGREGEGGDDDAVY